MEKICAIDTGTERGLHRQKSCKLPSNQTAAESASNTLRARHERASNTTRARHERASFTPLEM